MATHWGYLTRTWIAVTVAVALFQSPSAMADKPRVWQSKDGKYKVEATLIDVNDTSVTVKKADGKQVTVPIDKLCEADQKFLQSWRNEQPVPGIVPDELGPAVDLLALIDPAKHSLKGTAKQDGKTLISPVKQRWIVQVPYDMPEQYQLRVVATRTSAPKVLGMAVPLAGHQGLVVLDSGYGKKSGLVWIDGNNEPANSTYFRESVFKTDTPAEIIYRVHRNHIHVTCDGKTIVEWSGDPSRLKLDNRWWSGIPRGKLMLSTWLVEYHVSAFEMRPILRAETDAYDLRGNRADPAESVALIDHPAGSGTGFLAAPNLLVTNHHVIDGARTEDFEVTFPKQERPLPVHAILFSDAQRDLAILSVQTDRPPLPISHDGHFEKGGKVAILGNPSVGGGVTLRNARVEGTAKALLRIGDVDVVQIDANINPGSSGGPILNELGQVVGVTVMKATDEGEKLIRDGLRRFDDSQKAKPDRKTEKGVALGIPVRALVSALDQTRTMQPSAATQVTHRHDAAVTYNRLATLAAIRMLQALSGVPETMYRQEALARASGSTKIVGLLPLTEARKIKAALANDQTKALIARCENGLNEHLQHINSSVHFSADAKRDFSSLHRKVVEISKFAARPSQNYRQFSTSMLRFEESLTKLLERTEAAL